MYAGEIARDYKVPDEGAGMYQILKNAVLIQERIVDMI